MYASKITPPVRAVPSVFALALLTACWGGGSSGSSTPGATELVTYDPTSFSYVDLNPVDFHPVGKQELLAIEREEVVMMLASGPGEPAIETLYRDDAQASGGFEAVGGGWLDYGFEPMASAVGDVYHLRRRLADRSLRCGGSM